MNLLIISNEQSFYSVQLIIRLALCLLMVSFVSVWHKINIQW